MKNIVPSALDSASKRARVAIANNIRFVPLFEDRDDEPESPQLCRCLDPRTNFVPGGREQFSLPCEIGLKPQSFGEGFFRCGTLTTRHPDCPHEKPTDR